MACCVPGCDNTGDINNKTFFEFPCDPYLASKWTRSINLSVASNNLGSFTPDSDAVVCSDHFLCTDFRPNLYKRILKPNIIPTVFVKPSQHVVKSVQDVSVKRKIVAATFPTIVKVAKPGHDSQIASYKNAKGRLQNSITNTSLKRATENYLHVPVNTASSALNNCSVRSKIIPKGCGSKISTVPMKPNVRRSLIKQKTCHTQSQKSSSMNLIEIGPSTFLKINPDVIKVTEKVTPAGNTVLQFLMNTNSMDASNLFQVPPTVIEKSSSVNPDTDSEFPNNSVITRPDNLPKESLSSSKQEVPVSSVNGDIKKDSSQESSNSGNEENVIPEALSANSNMNFQSPALLTTSFPIRRSEISSSEKQARYFKALKQKNRQIHSLRTKVTKLTKKLEEIETKCIVQERQLNFPSMKKLKVIKKSAEEGDPHATFILEQIRGYSRNVQVRWSVTTLNQCSVWCRKAPYAYEFFKKADLFRLPALATVKRYLKSHPDVTSQIKNRTLNVPGLNSEDSSSDFEFDDEDNGDEEGLVDEEDDDGNKAANSSQKLLFGLMKDACKTRVLHGDNTGCPEASILEERQEQEVDFNSYINAAVSTETVKSTIITSEHVTTVSTVENVMSTTDVVSSSNGANFVVTQQSNVETESNMMHLDNEAIVPVSTSLGESVTSLNLNGQEIVLQPGNVIQLNATFENGGDFENQYFVINNTDEASSNDHQYGIGQPVSFVIQQGEDENQIVYVTESNSETQSVATISN